VSSPGLLIARASDKRAEAQRAGYPVLEPIPDRPSDFSGGSARKWPHGCEAQYSGSLAHDRTAQVLVLHPNGDVELVADMPVWRTDVILQSIVQRCFAEKAAWFRE
jgi:hypothetical protein